MTHFTIHSRKLDRNFTFICNLDSSRPHDPRYVRLETPGRTGTLAPQICYGGGFMGNTISTLPGNFEKICRQWYRQYIKDAESAK